MAETERNQHTLGELLAGAVDAATLAGFAERRVSGVYDDSRRVEPGGLFIALPGTREDGRRYIDDALRRGAIAVVGERLPDLQGAAGVSVPDARAVLAQVAARWYGLSPAAAGKLRLAGVTGTNGKSTTVFMTRSILNSAGVRCALLGTVYYDLCGRNVAASMTTPGALELAAYLREAHEHGAQAAAMEVSSHALDQKRTDGLRFDAAAFTNLTGDHLDYHGTFEAYRDAKKRLFDRLDGDAVAVVNADDPTHAEMVRDCPARVLTYAVDRDAELRATLSGSTSSGTSYRLRLEGRELALENALVGRHNVYNALAAAGLARALGVSIDAIAAGLVALRNVPGRLQRVPCASEADVFVDYAHTDDALRNVLSVLRPLTRGRLLVVFGCGGDRDRTKRPRMARVAAEFADAAYVTSDNPRTEDPQAIIREILEGFEPGQRARVVVQPDRSAAIHAAIAEAARDDIVLIAGKGHENYQVIGTDRIHFDDVEVAISAAAAARRPATGRV